MICEEQSGPRVGGEAIPKMLTDGDECRMTFASAVAAGYFMKL